MDHLSRRDGTRAIQRLNAWIGARFEDYAYRLLERSYGTTEPSLQMLFRGQGYGPKGQRKEATDAILLIGDAAVFFEMTITAPAAEILLEGSAERFKTEFLSQRLQPKLAKLEERVQAFRDGRLDYIPGGTAHVRRIYPLLVTLQTYPLHPIFEPLYSEALSTLSLLSGSRISEDGVRRVRVVSIEELEMLEGPLGVGKADLVAMLQDWHMSDVEDREGSLKNYLLLRRGFEEMPSEALREQFDAAGRDMREEASRLFGLA